MCRRARGLGRLVGGDDAIAYCQHNQSQHVVDHGARHDRDALLGIHLLPFGENARRDAYRGGGGHDAHVERAGLHHGLRKRHGLERLYPFDVREEHRQKLHGAPVAQEKREDHAAQSHHRSDEGILEEQLQVGFQARKEEQDDGGERGYAVERRGCGVVHMPFCLKGPERRAVEKTVLEKSAKHIRTKPDAAQRPRSNQDSRAQFAKDGRHLQKRGN